MDCQGIAVSFSFRFLALKLHHICHSSLTHFKRPPRVNNDESRNNSCKPGVNRILNNCSWYKLRNPFYVTSHHVHRWWSNDVLKRGSFPKKKFPLRESLAEKGATKKPPRKGVVAKLPDAWLSKAKWGEQRLRLIT